MRFRVAWFRLLGAQIEGPCWMQDVWIPRNPWDIKIESNVSLDRQVVLLTTGEPRDEPKIVIGSGTYINRFTMIDASLRVSIGRSCMIGPQCYLTDHDHGRLIGKLVQEQPLESTPVEIGDDVWIGAGVIVLKGVQIGNGSIVGAGAVVTKNVNPREIVAGVPIRVIGLRE